MRVDGPAWSKEGKNLGGQNHPQKDYRDQDGRQEKKDPGIEALRLLFPLPRERLGQCGNEGGGEGSLGKEFPKHVGDPVGHIEEVGHGARSETLGDQHVSCEPRDAGEE